jgi:hypothetical protein
MSRGCSLCFAEKGKAMVKPEKSHVLKLLDAYMKPGSGAMGDITELLSAIEQDPRLPMLRDGVEAFKTIVAQLHKEFPEKGYGKWLPGGEFYKDAEWRLQRYWEAHTASGL